MISQEGIVLISKRVKLGKGNESIMNSWSAIFFTAWETFYEYYYN